MKETAEFNLDKMNTLLLESRAHYELVAQDEVIKMNELIGQNLRIQFLKEINCTHCGKKTPKSYSGGYCYRCSIKLAECDMCILRPHTCHFEQGTCRGPEWGLANCMIPHYVYLANSSGLKVGITRSTQVPTRWIDQGASFALPILKVGTRYQSGVFEKLLSSEISDRTDWRKMLRGEVLDIDLEEKRDELFEMFGDEIDDLENQFGGQNVEILEKGEVVSIEYPVDSYPTKVNSISLDKQEVVEGRLQGIKGQYLIFDVGVINIRSHTGHKVKLTY